MLATSDLDVFVYKNKKTELTAPAYYWSWKVNEKEQKQAETRRDCITVL